MPQLTRNVFSAIPHHITQRGNRREDVFFSDEDCQIYLAWLKEDSQKHGLEVLSYDEPHTRIKGSVPFKMISEYTNIKTIMNTVYKIIFLAQLIRYQD